MAGSDQAERGARALLPHARLSVQLSKCIDLGDLHQRPSAETPSWQALKLPAHLAKDDEISG